MAEQSGDILIIQVGTADAQIHRNVTEEQCLNILKERNPALANALGPTHARLSAIRREVLTNPDKVIDYYLLQAAQAQADERLNLDLADLSEAEQSKRIEEYHQFTSIGSALLYRDANFGGPSKFFTVTWPNMKWWPYRFNDRASSAKAWGGNILFQHSWYGGRRLYLIGLPYVQFGDLSAFNFNDIASSFVSIG